MTQKCLKRAKNGIPYERLDNDTWKMRGSSHEEIIQAEVIAKTLK